MMEVVRKMRCVDSGGMRVFREYRKVACMGIAFSSRSASLIERWLMY